MSATTVAVTPAAAPPPARSPAGPASPADERRFDRHLDAARQQHGQARDPSPQDADRDSPKPKGPVAAATHDRQTTQATAKDEGSPDAAALAAAMLALIGQAAPAKPLAQAVTGTHAPAKAVAGAEAATDIPPALLLLAGTAANTAVTAAATATATATAKPGIAMDTGALAAIVAKPAEQKDAPLDALQMANLSSAAQATPAPASAIPAHTLDIASPAGTPAFAQELGQHVAWLGTQDIKQARIRLHPEELGSMDVKVSVNHDRIDVSFAVQHPAAVHAVQQTLPQLDTLLAQHGLALGHADVGQRQQHGEGGPAGEGNGAIGEVESEPAVMASAPVAALGMLDTFA